MLVFGCVVCQCVYLFMISVNRNVAPTDRQTHTKLGGEADPTELLARLATWESRVALARLPL